MRDPWNEVIDMLCEENRKVAPELMKQIEDGSDKVLGIDKLKAENESLCRQISELHKTIERLQTENQQLTGNLEGYMMRCRQLEDKNKQLQAELLEKNGFVLTDGR